MLDMWLYPLATTEISGKKALAQEARDLALGLDLFEQLGNVTSTVISTALH
jgi:hypothetical protein